MKSPSLHFGLKIRVTARQYGDNTKAAAKLQKENPGSWGFDVDTPYGPEKLYQSVVLTHLDGEEYSRQLHRMIHSVNQMSGKNGLELITQRYSELQDALEKDILAADDFDAILEVNA